MNMTSKLKSLLISWVAIYPTITLLLLIAEPFIADLSLPLRTLLLTVILVPFMMFIGVPMTSALFDRFAKKSQQ